MKKRNRIHLWNTDTFPSEIFYADEWCLTKDGWRRVDITAELIRQIAREADFDVEVYEAFFALTGDSLDDELFNVSIEEAELIKESVDSFFIRQ